MKGLLLTKPSILKFLSCMMLWFASLAYAVDSADLLPPDQAFSFTAKMKNANTLLLSWDIADGCYLYRHKFKFMSLTPGIKLREQSFPASEPKHDTLFGDVEIYRNHLEAEVPLQREDPKLNKLILEAHFQGCAEASVCYMPGQQTVSVDLSDDSFNCWGAASSTDKTTPFISKQNRIAASLRTRYLADGCLVES